MKFAAILTALLTCLSLVSAGSKHSVSNGITNGINNAPTQGVSNAANQAAGLVIDVSKNTANAITGVANKINPFHKRSPTPHLPVVQPAVLRAQQVAALTAKIAQDLATYKYDYAIQQNGQTNRVTPVQQKINTDRANAANQLYIADKAALVKLNASPL